MTTLNAELLAARRDEVLQSFASAVATNRRLFLEGDHMASSHYIFDNQAEDAANIVDIFHSNPEVRAVSIAKRTKVGADGLMIEIAKLFSTHIDDSFVASETRIITGMSNAAWERSMIEKAPTVFKQFIHHHGQLSKAGIDNIRDAVIIIDEIDAGSREQQQLHILLKCAGLLDIEATKTRNIRFVFISATIVKELNELAAWGNSHRTFNMTIPTNYVGHEYFLNTKLIRNINNHEDDTEDTENTDDCILQQFYPLNTLNLASKWVKTDIIDMYNDDYRVHLVRVNERTKCFIQIACADAGIDLRDHTSDRRLSRQEIESIFIDPLSRHIVIAVKGFFRRANLIPNIWKARIGAMHELHTNKVDDSVQVQGFPGRMTGYWKELLESGHKTGPFRTSILSIRNYINSTDPDTDFAYSTVGYSKKMGSSPRSRHNSMLSSQNIENLSDQANSTDRGRQPVIDPSRYRIYRDQTAAKGVCKHLGYTFIAPKRNAAGFVTTSLNKKASIVSVHDAVKAVANAYGTHIKRVKKATQMAAAAATDTAAAAATDTKPKRDISFRTYYPCYATATPTDPDSLLFVVIIRPGTDPKLVKDVDDHPCYNSIPITDFC